VWLSFFKFKQFIVIEVNTSHRWPCIIEVPWLHKLSGYRVARICCDIFGLEALTHARVCIRRSLRVTVKLFAAGLIACSDSLGTILRLCVLVFESDFLIIKHLDRQLIEASRTQIYHVVVLG